MILDIVFLKGLKNDIKIRYKALEYVYWFIKTYIR